MDIITIVVVLIFVGVALWLVNAYIPMQPMIKNILNVVIVLAILLWLASMFLGSGSNLRFH